MTRGGAKSCSHMLEREGEDWSRRLRTNTIANGILSKRLETLDIVKEENGGNVSERDQVNKR